MRIGIPDDYADVARGLECFKKLAGHEVSAWTDAMRDVDTLAERFRDIDAIALLRERTPMTGELIRRLPNLKLLTATGPYPNVDARACTEEGVAIAGGPGLTFPATAELTWGLIIAVMRQIPQQMQSLREGGWQKGLGTGLRGRTLGVLGYGRVGTTIASYGKAFGMNVLVWSRERGRKAAEAAGFRTCEDVGEVYRTADVLTIHIRYRPETRGIVTAAHLALMKPSAVFINTSRAPLIEPGALYRALVEKRIAGAAIDVYEREPGPDDPLIHLSQVVCTPHVGYFERDLIESLYSQQFDRILAYARGAPVDIQNPEALSHPRHRK